jgi:hypothetical protein
MPATYLENYERLLGKGTGYGEVIRFKCPFSGCSGYNKKAFCVNVRTGTWCCHHCNQERPDSSYRKGSSGGHGGSAGEFAEMMNDDLELWPTTCLDYIPPAKTLALPMKKRKQFFTYLFSLCQLTPEHREAVLARGINPDAARMVSAEPGLLQLLLDEFDDETVLRGGVAYLDRKGVPVIRQCISVGRLLIPYYEDNQVHHFVGYQRCPTRRPDQSIEDYQSLRESWPKITGPAGYTPAIYGDVPENCELVIVTEGQFKAEAARQKGLACIGVQGMMNSHGAVVRLLVQQKAKKAIICFDTEVEEQDNVDWAAEKLARELLKAGVETYRCRLPLDPAVDKGRKMDIDSFLNAFGVGSFAKQLASSRPYELRPEETEGNADEQTTETDIHD